MSPATEVYGLSDNFIFDFCPNPMWVYDIETLHFLNVNAEAVHQYGYSREQFLGMTLKDIRPEEDIPQLTTAIEHLHQRTTTFKKGFFRHKKKDGTVFPVLLKGNLISYEGRKAELVTATDITETVQSEKMHLYQMRLFQCISDINNNLIRSSNWSSALDTCFTIIIGTLKIQRAYFLQSDILDDSISLKLFRTDNSEEPEFSGIESGCLPFSFMKVLLGPMRKGRKFQKTLSALTCKRTKDIFEARQVKSLLAMPIFVQNKFRGFIGLDDCGQERIWTKEELQLMQVLTTNLSHLINQSDALDEIKASRRMFKSLVQNGTDLISVIGSDGKFRYASPTYQSQLGYDRDKLLGTRYMDKVFPQDVPKLEETFQNVLCKGQLIPPPYRLMDANGNWKWVESVFTNRMFNPNINGIVVNSTNVTDKMFLELKEKLVFSITKELGRLRGLKNLLSHALKEINLVTQCVASEVWLSSRDGTRLNLIAKRHQGKEGKHFFQEENTLVHFELNQGLPGKVWASQKITTWDSIAEHLDFARANAAGNAGIRSAIGIPLFNGKEFIGCFTLFFKEPKEQLAEILILLDKIGHDLGGVIKQSMVEEEYREFFELSPDPFCIIGFDGRVKQVNQACERVLGFSSEHILGEPYDKFIYESDRNELNNKLVDGTPFRMDVGNEIRMVTANGEVRCFVWSGTVNKEEKLFLVVAKDITEQKRAEKSMKSALEKLHHAQRMAKLGYWYRDMDSEISEWSPETYAIYGYSPDNFEPTIENVIKTFHPEDRYLMEDHPKDHVQPDKINSFEHRIITAQGHTRWVQQEIQMIFGKDGNPSHIEGVIQDITERKEHEQQLKISNQRFLLAMLASNQMIWEFDHGNDMLIHSHHIEGEGEQIIKEPFNKESSWFKRIHAEDRERVWKALKQNFYKAPSKHWSNRYRVVQTDGSIRHVVDKSYTQWDGHGKPIRTIGSVIDITVTRNQMEKIKSQNKVLSDVAWLQSHAIRSPLTRIMALLNHYETKGDGVIGIEDMFQMISSSIQEIDKELHKIIKLTDNR